MSTSFVAFRTFLAALVVILLTGGPCLAVILEPTGLQDGQLLPKNKAEFRVGFSYADNLHNQFQDEDRDRRVFEVPSLTINLGLAERVEAQIQYSYLHLREDGQGDQCGSGDVTLGLKVRLWRESLRLPAIAVRLATKLPNADDDDDLGTDEADVFVDLLFTRNFPLFSLYVNTGLAILGDPRPHNNGQDDLFRYGIGVRVPVWTDKLDVLVSVEGQEGDESINNRGAVRAGIQANFGRFIWDLGGSLGYVSKSEDWSIRSGLTTRFDLPTGW